MICFIKFNQKIWRWLGKLGYLYLIWFVTFFQMLWLYSFVNKISIMQYGSNFIVFPFQFIGRFNVGSIRRMRNTKALALFIWYKSEFIMNWKVIYLEKIRNLLLSVCILKKEMCESSNTFDRLLIYWEIQVK